MPDHGEPIAGLELQQQVALIEQILSPYAELQRRTADLTDRWIAAGVPDRSLQRLPTLLEGLLVGRGRTGPLPIEADEVARLASVVEVFARVCDQLTDTSVGSAIDHADIHGTNVLLGDTGSRLIDWGDSCIGHPFASLLVPLEWVAGQLAGDDRPRAVARLVDAYMEPWGDDGDTVALGHSIWTGYVARAVSNDEQCIGGSPGDIVDAQREIVALLRTWHDKHALLDRPDALLVPGMSW